MISQFDTIEHENTLYELPKLRNAAKINFGDIHGVLPFEGLRNPITVSNSSHKVSFQYKTPANNWQPRLGLVESAGELVVAEEILIGDSLYDLEFQPLAIRYQHPTGGWRTHYIDLRQTFSNGLTRLIFVRNASSLRKPYTQAEIQAIKAAVPAKEAHQFVVVDADSYSRPRRENLRRMHRLIAFQTDAEADAIVEEAAGRCRTLWLLSDLFDFIDLPRWRIFQSCLRLIGKGKLGADFNAVIGQHSRIWVPAA